MELAGQVAIVTGAARGIGKAIACTFAAAGADVVLADRDHAGASTAAAEIVRAGQRATARMLDVTVQDDVDALVSDVIHAHGRLDICVTNAGFAVARPFLEITREDWQRHLDTHLSGSFFCAQAAARVMVERGYGRLICMASIASFTAPPGLAAYGTVKAGVLGLVRSMALDLADTGVTANAIAPGPVDTEMLRAAWSPAAFAERGQQIPLGRVASVDDVARTALFLASPAAGYLTGTVINVDGGVLAAGGYMVEKYRRRKFEE